MKNFILAAFCLGTTCIYAQDYGHLSGSFESNAKWYINDPKTGPFVNPDDSKDDEQVRSNNYLELDYTYKKWAAGILLESYLPKPLLNYSPKYDDTGISTFYAEYRGKKLKVTAGYFYEQFGSGLILRAWEDRQLGINNALRGGRITYRPTSDLMFTALYGRQKEGFELSDGKIFGFNTEIGLSELMKIKDFSLGLGFSYVGRYQEIEYPYIDNPNFEELTNAFSGRLDFYKGSFYASAEYVTKIEDVIVERIPGRGPIVNNDFIKPGNAFLLNIGYASAGLGINATLRRLENMGFFSDREAAGNKYNANIINFIPALTKQHDYLLTNIYVYQAQPYVSIFRPQIQKAGEIGGQFDIYYKFKKGTALGGEYGTKLALNASYWANLKGEYESRPSRDYEVDFFGFGEKYFSDISFEVRKRLSPKLNTIFTYVNQYYNRRLIEERSGVIQTDIAVAEVNYQLNQKQSFRLVAQHLWTQDDKKNWVGGTVEFNLNHQWSFYVSDIYNYGNEVEAEQIHYYNVGGSYTVGASRFALNYGRQRGGIVCVGGVCRYVPESTGLSASISVVF